MAHDVFISYSAPDRSTADAICAALEGEGINCWIAPRNVLPSVEYSEAIVDAIAAASILVLVFSANSNKSRDVASELDLAFQNEKDIPILAFRIENLKPSKGTAYYLSTSHWFDAFTPPLESHLKRLVNDVQSLLKREPSPKPSPTPIPTPLVPPVLMKILIAVGVALALFIFGRLLFKPQTGIGSNGNEDVVKNQNNNTTSVANTPPSNISTGSTNDAQTGIVNPVNGNTRTGTMTNPTSTGDNSYQQQYDRAIVLLNDKNPANIREGIRLLGEVCKSGNADWYWIAMNQLTDYVRDNAPWDENDRTKPLPGPVQRNIFRALEVIAAQRPPYPTGATDTDKRNRRRNLESTDLRGLKLLGGVAELEYVSFRGANLDGAVLRGANLVGATFEGSSLRRTDLYGADLLGVAFGDANLNGTKLRHAKNLTWSYVGAAFTWPCAELDEALRKELIARNAPKTKCE